MGFEYILKSNRKRDLADVGVVSMDELLDFEGRYLKSDSINECSLSKSAVASTVFISSNRDKPNGSGVIVNYDGKKYLITATHILGSKAFGTPTDLKVFERHGKDILIRNLEDMTMIYSTPQSKERNLPNADIGIFLYNGDLEGVKLADQLNPKICTSIAVGYPVIHADMWMPDLHPTISPGKAIIQEKKKQQLTPYMQKLLTKHEMLDIPETIHKILFTGSVAEGNSGGGLFTLDGKLLGICKGPNGTIGKETGLQEFYPVIQILEAVKINKTN